ncbi:uncharacterized protein F5891DRAFT_1186095 [Suillus fuscotomentosus]|uniref:Uncharacterized protein n=1 Tax=Suillus fuscotomentosus TaxID=1912939 RepID=A0AAD4HPP0_9AGAM|nr:uncharacterized protein F5891DRAFT_1186095 [Suillus fuscotomentosus]KAG1902954.1 hypothetical protein F5891DRAFT_1186095 [Suillus fuscotomentosus]
MSTLTVANTSHACHTPHRNYETTTNSTPQGTPQPMTWNPKAGNGQPNRYLVKSATPVFRPQLGIATESTTITSESKTSLPIGIRETEKNKMPKLPQASAVAMIGANPLFDRGSDDNNLRHLNHRLTSKMIKRNSETGHVMEFHSVEVREYNMLQNVLEERGRVRPRLTYDYIERLLLVDMPSTVHGVPFTKIKDSFASTLQLLPYNHKLICSDVNMNLTLEIPGRSVIPNICTSMMKAKGLANELLIPLIGECACSVTVASTLERMGRIIRAHLEAAVAILAIVQEVKANQCPQVGSIASETLSASERPMVLKQFITKEFTLGEPVKITGHDWCHLSSVEYMVWIKKDGEAQISIDDHDEEYMAHGIHFFFNVEQSVADSKVSDYIQMLFPEIRMDGIVNMLRRGLEKVKDMFINFTQWLDETMDVTWLEEARAMFSIDWDDTVSLLNGAVHSTSHARYVSWHDNIKAETEPQQIGAGKCTRDSSYTPSPSESSASDTDFGETSTISRGRPRRKQHPASQPPPRKSEFYIRKHRI